MNNSHTIPEEFYVRWNISSELQERCDVYELLQITRQDLRLLIYKKWFKVQEDGEEVLDLELLLLHKGQLYNIVWQNESFEAYALLSKWPESTKFIISLRRIGKECVAIIQRKRT